MADTKMTKSVGEHWACATLARHGWAPALTRDGLERTDILAVATHLDHRPTVEIQVKATMSAGDRISWLLGEKAQLPDLSGHEWFVLVSIPTMHADPPRAFVVPRDHVAAAAWIVHMNWLTDPLAPPGKRNAPVAQARIKVENFERYEERWDLLGEPTPTVPVLLPPELRDQSQEPRVGLPPEHPWHHDLPSW
ncbi:hypothetical protein [Nocardioides taihuensis]|uniref:DUF4365 domain-containing protein n=1 Tax=Nocardioides taihuensis TaxID=1835606 RepID=A0ABW0BQN6_9ACTN